MTSAPHDHRHDGPHGPQTMEPLEEFDPANAELSAALRKSFRVLKIIMFVLIALYFMSGVFSVKPYEAGVVLRFGQIVGMGGPDEVKMPGWHWSLPFPIDQWQVVPTSEREIEVEFMIELTAEERATGKLQAKYNNLFPERDDYLVTGDVNILHAKLIVKYRIDNVVEYITNVWPEPSPKADVLSRAFLHYPEYTLMRNMARDAVISTAARFGALDIRGSRQDEFLLAVGRTLNEKLKALSASGAPLGIYIDENTGVIAPKSETGQLEAIMPPRQTQEVFDQVFSAQTNKSVAITKSRSEAESMLVNAAGPDYMRLSEAINAEYEIILRLSKAEAAERGGQASEAVALREELAAASRRTEELLASASGGIRGLIKDAEIERDRMIKEAAGDYNRFMAVLPEYLHNPSIFKSRMVDEARSRALSDDDIVKVFVPTDARQFRLHIPRAGGTVKTEEERRREEAKKRKENIGLIARPEIRGM